MDVRMPVLDGITATDRIVKAGMPTLCAGADHLRLELLRPWRLAGRRQRVRA